MCRPVVQLFQRGGYKSILAPSPIICAAQHRNAVHIDMHPGGREIGNMQSQSDVLNLIYETRGTLRGA